MRSVGDTGHGSLVRVLPCDDRRTVRKGDTILSLLPAIPFDERTTFSISAGRFDRAAHLPNYHFAKNSVMFGVSWRF